MSLSFTFLALGMWQIDVQHLSVEKIRVDINHNFLSLYNNVPISKFILGSKNIKEFGKAQSTSKGIEKAKQKRKKIKG